MRHLLLASVAVLACGSAFAQVSSLAPTPIEPVAPTTQAVTMTSLPAFAATPTFNIGAMPPVTGSVALNAALPAGNNTIGAISNQSFGAAQVGVWSFGLNTGDNVIGKVGIDESMPGTTNLVTVTPYSGIVTNPDDVVCDATTPCSLLTTRSRKFLSITNTGSGTCRIAYSGVAPSASRGDLLLNAGANRTFDGSYIPSGSVSAYCVAASTLAVIEGQ